MDFTRKKIIRGFKIYTKKILWPILHLYDITFKKEMICSVADLMLLRDGEIYNRQFYVAARLLDAKLYYEKGDKTLPFQVAVSYNYRPASYDRDKRTREYIELMDSVKKNGYDINSHLIIDKELYLINGTHRIALALYNNIPEIKVYCWNRKNIIEKGFERRPLSTLPTNILNTINFEFNQIQNKLIETGQSFIFWLSCNNVNEAKQFFQQQEKNFIFFKYYQNLNSNLFFDNTFINNGFFALCRPLKSDYKITKSEYYSNFVYKTQDKLKKIYNQNLSFYISPNCKKGYHLFELLKSNIKEVFL